ncbi:MAG TPA: hypothetical protein VMW17_19770 [Candidatus Binatia bacterium]|nr:hypothetical protein [Candidatus Binatia bacterium]
MPHNSPVASQLDSRSQSDCSAAFGKRTPLRGGRRVVFWLLVAASVGLLFGRRPDAVTTPQFWAEDGAVFFADQYRGTVRPWTLYRGYCHLIPRVVAGVATLLPLKQAPLVYNVSALILAAVSIAWFSLPHFRHLVKEDSLRASVCIALAVLPTAHEILATITNLQWYLGLWGALVCFQPIRGRRAKMLVALAYVAAVFSAPYFALFVPILLLRAWFRREDLTFCLGLVGIQVVYAVAILLFGDSLHLTFSATRVRAACEWFSVRSILGVLLGPWVLMHSLRPYSTILAWTALALFVAGASGCLLQLRRDRGFLLFSMLAAYLAFACVMLFVATRLDALVPGQSLALLNQLQNNFVAAPRFFVLPSTLVLVWGSAAFSRLRGQRWMYAAGAAWATLMVIASVANYRFAPRFIDYDWPLWAARLQHSAAVGDPLPEIPINPEGWRIKGLANRPSQRRDLSLIELTIA